MEQEIMNMRFRSIILIGTCLFVATSTGCSTRQGDEHAFQVRDIGGVMTAVNSGGPKYSEELFTYEKVLTLQQDPDRPESLLHNAFSLTMDQEGIYYVEDHDNYRIAVFDSEGNYVRSIGRQGEGPGEFTRGWRLRSLQGDRLTVYDRANRRATLLRTDGTVEDIFTLPKAVSNISEMYRTPENHWVALHSIFAERAALRYERAGFTTIDTELDTLGSAETEMLPTSSQYQIVLDIEGERMELPGWMPMVFAPRPEADYMPGSGVLLTTGKEPVLSWYRTDGTCYRRITLDIPVRPLTDKEKNDYLTQLDSRIDEQEEGRFKVSLRRARKTMVFTETKGCWSSVMVDDAGYIWLQVPESREERQAAGSGYLYRLLDPSGEYLGLTRLPAEGEIRQGCLLAIDFDPDTDEEIPTVWRLIPQVEGFRYP